MKEIEAFVKSVKKVFDKDPRKKEATLLLKETYMRKSGKFLIVQKIIQFFMNGENFLNQEFLFFEDIDKFFKIWYNIYSD